MTEQKVQNIYDTELINPNKPVKTKSLIKIQMVNQDLNEAINQMKTSFRKKSLIQKTNKKTSNTCPQSNPQNPSKLYFTETYKKKYEYKLKEIDEKRKTIQARSLAKQMKARLSKKIKENTDLNQKMRLLQDLQQKKQQLLTEQRNRKKKQQQQKKFLHQCSMQKFNMLRNNKKRVSLNDLKDSRIIDKQSRKEHMFKVYMDEKQKQEHQMLLRTKLQFSMKKPDVIKRILKSSNLSQRSVKSSFKDAAHQRGIYTSQKPRSHKLKIKPEEDEDAITQFYLQKNNEQSIQSNTMEQKKYNQNARTPKSNSQIRNSEIKIKQSSMQESQNKDVTQKPIKHDQNDQTKQQNSTFLNNHQEQPKQTDSNKQNPQIPKDESISPKQQESIEKAKT